jgi:hypothetical protein
VCCSVHSCRSCTFFCLPCETQQRAVTVPPNTVSLALSAADELTANGTTEAGGAQHLSESAKKKKKKKKKKKTGAEAGGDGDDGAGDDDGDDEPESTSGAAAATTAPSAAGAAAGSDGAVVAKGGDVVRQSPTPLDCFHPSSHSVLWRCCLSLCTCQSFAFSPEGPCLSVTLRRCAVVVISPTTLRLQTLCVALPRLDQSAHFKSPPTRSAHLSRAHAAEIRNQEQQSRCSKPSNCSSRSRLAPRRSKIPHRKTLSSGRRNQCHSTVSCCMHAVVAAAVAADDASASRRGTIASPSTFSSPHCDFKRSLPLI